MNLTNDTEIVTTLQLKAALIPRQEQTFNPYQAVIDNAVRSIAGLSSLSIQEVLMVWRYFAEDLPGRIDDRLLGETMDAEEWFLHMSSTQQDQVNLYGCSQNIGKQVVMVANWYENFGPSGAFRFEILIPHPATSR